MINMAIIGAGNIAGNMANTIKYMPEVNMYAVAARDANRAEEFAKKYGFERAYGSYEEMLLDDAIDLVYVATPHSHHFEHMKMCVEHGRNVICEKAFTVNAKQAKEIFKLAKEKNVLVTEAIWTRYMPSCFKLKELLESKKIGEPKMLTANLGYPISHVERLIKPELAGGALLDVGVYTINFASMAFGNDIEAIHGTAVLNEYGVDAQNGIVITYKNGNMAVLNSTMMAQTDLKGIIYGTKGHLVVDNINDCRRIDVYDEKNNIIETYIAPEQITGFEYQVESCVKAISESRKECPEMPHDETVLMMEWMDELRRQWGVKYPME